MQSLPIDVPETGLPESKGRQRAYTRAKVV